MKNLLVTAFVCLILGNVPAQSQDKVTKGEKLIGRNTNSDQSNLPKIVISTSKERNALRRSLRKPENAQNNASNKTGSSTREFVRKLPDGTTYKISSTKNQGYVDDGEEKKDSPTVDSNKVTRICTSRQVSLLNSDPESLLLDNREQYAYVGSILDVNSILDGGYKPIVLKAIQQPIEISFSQINSSNSVSTSISPGTKNYISRADYANALNTLRNKLIEGGANSSPVIKFDLEEFYNEKQIAAFLNLSFGEEANPFFVKSENSGGSIQKKRIIIGKAIQKMYTVGMGGTDINTLYPENTVPNNAGIVSQVTYGIMKLARFETELSEDSLQIALDLKMGGSTPKGLILNTSFLNKIKNTKLKVLTIGVNTNNIPKELSLENLQDYLQTSVPFNNNTPGLPIGWGISFLDDGSVANQELATSFVVRNCQEIAPKKVTIQLTGIRPSKNNFDLCGKVFVKAINNGTEIQPISGKSLLLDCDCNNKSKWIRNLKKYKVESFTNTAITYSFTKAEAETAKIQYTFDIGDGLQDFENAFDVTGRNAIRYNLNGGKTMEENVSSIVPITWFISNIDSSNKKATDAALEAERASINGTPSLFIFPPKLNAENDNSHKVEIGAKITVNFQ